MADLHDTGDAIAQAVADANQTTDDQEAPEAAPQSSSGEDTGAEEALILGKFKDHDAVIEAYKNLEATHTRTAQETAELRRQVEEWKAQQADPEPASPFGVLGPDQEALDYIAQTQGPGMALYYAFEHADSLGVKAREYQNFYYQQWWMQDPFAAEDWRAEMRAAQSAQNAPQDDEPDWTTQWANDQIATGAFEWAKQHLYNFSEYQTQVRDWMDANPRIVEAITTQTPGPEGLTKLLDFAYRQVRTFDQPAADGQPAAPAPPAAPPAATRGQTRSTAPAGDDSYETGVTDLLLKAAREQGMQVHRAS